MVSVAGDDARPGSNFGLGAVTDEGGCGLENFLETLSWLPELKLGDVAAADVEVDVGAVNAGVKVVGGFDADTW